MIAPGETTPRTLAELMATLEPDQWRKAQAFSPDMHEANQVLWSTTDTNVAERELLEWLGRWQPCLFGRLAARHGAISTCVLFEEQLNSESDTQISDRIQEARTAWTSKGFTGQSSGFVILLISPILAEATPGPALFRLAKKLCTLYLLRDDIEADTVYHDEVFFEAGNRERSAWKWLAGVNFFGVCADKRWWHDHRIPGGLALSVNSVGHFVKSRIAAKAEAQFANALELDPGPDDLGKIESLEDALIWAMRTINGASNTTSGKATFLVDKSEPDVKAPCDMPRFLSGFDHRFYRGYYHTDFTLPSLYFRDDVTRPSEAHPIDLDLTYLCEEKATNPDYVLMGKGRRIRADEEESISGKERMARPVRVQVEDAPLLLKALSRGEV